MGPCGDPRLNKNGEYLLGKRGFCCQSKCIHPCVGRRTRRFDSSLMNEWENYWRHNGNERLWMCKPRTTCAFPIVSVEVGQEEDGEASRKRWKSFWATKDLHHYVRQSARWSYTAAKCEQGCLAQRGTVVSIDQGLFRLLWDASMGVCLLSSGWWRERTGSSNRLELMGFLQAGAVCR